MKKQSYLIRYTIKFWREPSHLRLLIATIVTIIVGTIAYHFIEGWRWLDSLYFSVITLTTIGYGDLSPQTDLGKFFTVFFILFGMGLMGTFIYAVFEYHKKIRH